MKQVSYQVWSPHSLSKYEYSMDFTGLGDAVVEIVYSAYRREPKLSRVPTGYQIILAGKTFREIEYTEVNRDYFEKLAAAKYPVVPDRLSKQPRPVAIETFDTKRVITDGEQTVELISTGRSPHVQENVVAYLRKRKSFFRVIFSTSVEPTSSREETRRAPVS